MITQELIDYIKQSLENRQGREGIKNVLLENGWDDVDIKEAFREIDRNSNTVQKESDANQQSEGITINTADYSYGTQQESNKKTRLMVIILLGIFLLSVSSVAGYFIFVNQDDNQRAEAILDDQENTPDRRNTGKNSEIPSIDNKIEEIVQNTESEISNIGNDANQQDKKEVFIDTSSAPESSSPAPQAKVIAPPPIQIDTPASLATPIKITTCIDISIPGEYVLSQDIISLDKEPCIKIHDTSDVALDCAGYSITANARFYHNILVDKVENFSIDSCVLKNTAPTAFQAAFTVANSQGGLITNSIFPNTAQAAFWKSSNMKFTDNTVNSALDITYSKGALVQNNNFVFIPTPDKKQSGWLLSLKFGSNNIVRNNTFDGASDGIFKGINDSIGADDSIIISDESNDLIEDNYIKNNWDVGIESTEYIFDNRIINNNIKNTGIAGIGGWYYSSVKGNIFDGNVVENSPELFKFFRVYGIKNDAPPVYFKDNTFINNKLINQSNTQPASWFVIGIDGSQIAGAGIREVTKQDIITGNNIFRNNDFGKIRAPVFSPKDMIVDGGGNICAQSTAADYPLQCIF